MLQRWLYLIPKCRHTIIHTAWSDTIFIQINMDASPWVPGVSKDQEGHKDQYLDVFFY